MDKTWHPYIDYPSLETNELFEEFTLDRMSLFPAYDNFLSWLFGTRMESTTLGYTSEIINFSKIPIWSIFCRAGIYSWLLIYLLFYFIYQKRGKLIMILSFPLGIAVSIFLSPVIMYRYVAPLIFSAPLLVLLLFVREPKAETMAEEMNQA